MSFPTVRFEERRMVVAIVPEPQRDEPPGRGDVKTRTVVLIEEVKTLQAQEVRPAVNKVATSGNALVAGVSTPW